MNQNHSAYYFKGEAAGSIVYHNNTARVTTTSTGINVTGNNVVSGNVTAVDGTFSGNVSIGGTLTYEDVTNIDSVGIVTARDGIFIPDNNRLHIGNTSGTGDLQLYHNGTDSRIHSLTNTLSVRANIFNIRRYNDAQYFVNCTSSGAVELYKSNVKKLETDGNGITVQGNINMATDSTLFLGVGNDFKLFHNGTTNFIRSANGLSLIHI